MRADHDVLVEVPGVRPPAVRPLSHSALTAVWDSICFLPTTRWQHYCLERALTGPCAERDVIRYLAEHPTLVLPFGEYELRIRWANPEEGDPA
ncbi:hypothetical protein ACPC54_01915 [Kitasatospora sp. NPDC094028]